MCVASLSNLNSPPANRLRESRRVDGKIVKRTLAELTDRPAGKIESLGRSFPPTLRLLLNIGRGGVHRSRVGQQRQDFIHRRPH